MERNQIAPSFLVLNIWEEFHIFCLVSSYFHQEGKSGTSFSIMAGGGIDPIFFATMLANQVLLPLPLHVSQTTNHQFLPFYWPQINPAQFLSLITRLLLQLEQFTLLV
jgi:hypothetical protein